MPEPTAPQDELPTQSLPSRGGSLSDLEPSDDEVEEASEESFPASDPPAFNRHPTH